MREIIGFQPFCILVSSIQPGRAAETPAGMLAVPGRATSDAASILCVREVGSAGL